MVRASNYVYGVILFVLVMFAGLNYLGAMKANNPDFASEGEYSEFNHSFNRVADIQSSMGQIESSATQTNASSGFFAENFGFLEQLISKSWNTLKLLTQNFGFVGDSFSALSEMFGINPAYTNIFLLLTSAIIIFTIFTAVFKVRV